MLIGLTGGIGSGKTIVAQLFETFGAVIYNSDERAKEMYFDADVKLKIVSLLTEKAYLSNNTIDKDFISKAVFSDKILLEKLNNIIHPAVKNDFIEFEKKHNGKIIIKESAILFETGIYKTLDATILVTAPIPVKINRIKKRNGFTDEEINKRLKTQWSDEQKTPLTNYIIVNDNQHALIPQALQIFNNIKKHA